MRISAAQCNDEIKTKGYWHSLKDHRLQGMLGKKPKGP